MRRKQHKYPSLLLLASLLDTMPNPSNTLRNCTPEEVLETARHASVEYGITYLHFVSNTDVLSTLIVLGWRLQCVEERLESIVISGDDALHLRLDDIIIGDPAQQVPLLNSLSADLQTISSCLQGVRNGTSLSKPDADLYTNSLDRYVVLMENVQMRSMECVIFFLL
jgi:hypothetical protein